MDKPPTVLDVNTCPICKKVYSSKWSVSRHVDSTHKKKRYLCQLCNKIFARDDYLVLHLKNVHNENGPRKKAKTKKRSKRKDKPKSPKFPDSTTVFNSISYKNETSIHDDNTNFEDEEVNVEVEIDVSVPIKSDEEDSMLSVNWEDSLQGLRPTTERLHVEETSYNSFPTVNRIEEQHSEQMNNSVQHTEMVDLTYEGLLITTKEPVPPAVDQDIQEVPVIKAINEDCISIHSGDEEAPGSRRNKPDNQPARRLAEPDKQCTTPNRTCGENGAPAESQPKDSEADSSKRSRENDVLVDSNVFDLLKRRTLDSSDEDRMFLLSILSDFKKVLPQNKLSVKIKIAQAISDGS